jgi:hypothetical protein
MVVIVRLTHGLGNQLFQYAAGLCLAVHHGTDLRLDITALKEVRKDQPFRLNSFCIDEKLASSEDIAAFPGAQGDLVGRARYTIERIFNPYYRCSTFIERGFTFDPNLFRSQKDVYLFGYWQSEKYFSGIRGTLLKKLELRGEMSLESQRIAKMISETRAISVHVRRGDYANNPATRKFHGTCSREYYENCASLIKERIPDACFFVFSDEPDWARQNLNIGDKITYITSNVPSRPHEDLKLMSMCEGHIIANSTFSWWGAWLNRNPNKIVLAPRKWFNEAPNDTRDLIPDGWIRI